MSSCLAVRGNNKSFDYVAAALLVTKELPFESAFMAIQKGRYKNTELSSQCKQE